MALRIPKLDAANPATLTGEVDYARPASIGDSIWNRKFVVGAVVKVNNHSLELNRPAPDLEQEGSETHAVVHDNPIVIPPSVDIGSAEVLPSALVPSLLLRVRGNAQTRQQEQHQTAHSNQFLEVHAFSFFETAICHPWVTDI